MHIGLIGCGNMGNSLARALVATGEAQLSFVYDVRPDAAAAFAEQYEAKATSSVEALLACPGLDGVIVAAPPDLHAPLVIQAAEAGVDVFCEKPMALNVAGCEAMLAAAEQHRIKLMIGHVLRYYEPYRSIRRWQADGRFGQLYAASIWRVTDSVHRQAAGNWRASLARSGGYLFEVSAHELDMLRCLMGRPESVYAVSQKMSSGGECATSPKGEWADYLSLQIRFAKGGVAAYEGGAGSYARRYGFRFYFEQATLASDEAFDRHALQVYGADGEVIAIPEDVFSPVHPVEAELSDWLAALRDEAPVAIPGEEGLATVALVVAAYRSAEMGQIVVYE
ncbi:MAG: Gfo/Idh/MocA family oxidoreductase [Anaerolineae bacterium]|nr:Gfo/Idh/MocA family oxidoreductase [Anaerolineae bacterium]